MDRHSRLSQLADSYLEHIRIAVEVRDKSAPFRDFLDNWAAFASETDHHRRASDRVKWFNNPNAITRREMLLSLPFRSEGADMIIQYAKENPAKYLERVKAKDKKIRLIVDHTIPISVMVKTLMESPRVLNRDTIRNYLKTSYHLGLLSHSDDDQLRAGRLSSKMPAEWDGNDLIARYRAANIKLVHDIRLL